ncbi:MAG: hypothetical protein JWM93_1001 [Frankiales bacterium]|nr:hypothetical protein [Frankiales bacterium]
MTRRVSLPGADELFRSTSDLSRGRDDVRPQPEPADDGRATRGHAGGSETPRGETARPEAPRPESARTPSRSRAAVRHEPDRRPTGREKHEQKITVYCSEDELIDLEHARLSLRRENGIAVDRGRIVREAVALVLADLEAKGEDSILVRRLRGR